MNISKKLIAILLCLAMIPCLFLTAFADGVSDGDVLFSATFDGSAGAPASLAAAGLESLASSSDLQASINEDNGYLNVSSLGTKYNKIALTESILGSVSAYTVQATFRWIVTDGSWATDMAQQPRTSTFVIITRLPPEPAEWTAMAIWTRML